MPNNEAYLIPLKLKYRVRKAGSGGTTKSRTGGTGNKKIRAREGNGPVHTHYKTLFGPTSLPPLCLGQKMTACVRCLGDSVMSSYTFRLNTA